MASACVNNIGMSPENFLDCPATYASYGWLSPRMSFSREYTDDESKVVAGAGGAPKQLVMMEKKVMDALEVPCQEVSGKDVADFEFPLDGPVTMLPADELFSEGKLVPLHLSAVRPTTAITLAVAKEVAISEDAGKSSGTVEVLGSEAYLFSPKAPRCSSRWREFLGLKKLYQNGNKASTTTGATTSSNTSLSSSTAKSIKHFLHRSSKSTAASSLGDGDSLSVPLLKDYSDCESVSISSRLSLSSSSSGHDHDDLSRLSLDADKPNNHSQILLSISSSGQNPNPHPPKVRVVKAKPLIDHTTAIGSARSTTPVGRSLTRRAQQDPTTITPGVSVDSPRMNSSGKIVFQSLERSSSSPSSFNGGRRHKYRLYRGMERSYSAGVRITPVLNVPVCALRGSSKFGLVQLFSAPSQKKDTNNGSGSVGGSTKTTHQHNHNHHSNSSKGSRRERS
ncbi:hypothetical protein Ancab_004067 [Ancistrocladus abbreviatus]